MERYMYEEYIDSSESEHEDYNIPRFEKGPGPDKMIVVPELAKSDSQLRLEILCKKTSQKSR